MSRYYSFNDFMKDVLERADKVCQERHSVPLEEYYKVSNQTIRTTKKLLSSGWYVFAAVVALYTVGTLGLGAAILAFLATPFGIIAAAALGVTAFTAIKIMYKERILPNAVHDVGKEYKSKWEMVEGNCAAIDKLVSEAAEQLIRKASNNN